MSAPFRQLTIFHYHLLPGGVTDVIVLSARAVLAYLEGLEKVSLVYGRDENIDVVKSKILKGRSEWEERLELVHLDQLDYSEAVADPLGAEALAELLKKRFGGADNLWMVHNYQLGKNPTFTQALLQCTDDPGQSFLFQIHDFPECSRYANLARLKGGTSREIYPSRPNIAYCVINARDRNYLIESGMAPEDVTLLNNPVPLGPVTRADGAAVKEALYERYKADFPAMEREGKLLFYPVRTIRRKNVFEAAFLVKLLEKPVNFLVSLPGVSKTEKAYSDLAERAFREGLIPGLCGIGRDEETELINYPNFWAASDLIISPSIQEGFGYLYLNALHWEKPLFTRYLDIMEGFKPLFKADSSHFYEEIPVPLTQDEADKLMGLYLAKLKALSEYMPEGREAELKADLEGLFDGGTVCFSYLPPDMQYEFLRKLEADGDFRARAAELNRDVLDALEALLERKQENCDDEIDKTFGERNYTMTLQGIMNGLANHGPASRGPEERQDGGNEEPPAGDTKNIQGKLEEIFFSLPYLRLLYGEGK